MLLPKFISLQNVPLLIKQAKPLFLYSQAQSIKSEKMNDSIFIRHAHSQFNQACQNFRIKNHIPYDWEALNQHSEFQQKVALNPNFIDCPLTKKGVEQCYLTSQNINFKQIDIILVSPHQRALQTCRNIIKYSSNKLKIPTIVQPLIGGSLWSSCDITKKLSQKLSQFPQFDFSLMKNQPQLWFLQNLKPQHKLKVYLQISKRKLVSFKDKQLLILQMMRNKQIVEDRQILRKRSWLIKQSLQKLKENHCNILLISHYYIIQYVNTTLFDDRENRPLKEIDFENCHPYYNNVEQMLCYK